MDLVLAEQAVGQGTACYPEFCLECLGTHVVQTIANCGNEDLWFRNVAVVTLDEILCLPS